MKLTNLKNEAQKIHLSEKEKALMYARIVGLSAQAGEPQAVPSYRVSHFQFFSLKFVPVMAALLIVVLGGGTAYAAQGALPGDLLYPVKISVNERMELVLAVTPEAKVQAEVKLAERRVVEAEELEAAGRLDVETTTELEQAFEAHVKRALAFAERASSTEEEVEKEGQADTSGELKESEEPEEDVMALEMTEEVSTSSEDAVAMTATTSATTSFAAKVGTTATTTEEESTSKKEDEDRWNIRELLEERRGRLKELRERLEQRGSEVKGEFIEEFDFHKGSSNHDNKDKDKNDKKDDEKGDKDRDSTSSHVEVEVNIGI